MDHTRRYRASDNPRSGRYGMHTHVPGAHRLGSVGGAVLYWRSMQLFRRLVPRPNPRPIELALLIAAAMPICFGAHAAAIGPKDRRLTNVRVGISIEAPAGWTFSQHTGYADTVALLVHPDGSRVSLTVAGTILQSAAALIESNRPGFLAQGLVPSLPTPGARGSLGVDLQAPGRIDRNERVRQLYLVRNIPGGRQAVVLTLVCGAKVFAARALALDFVAARMSLEDPVSPLGMARVGVEATGGTATGGHAGR